MTKRPHACALFGLLLLVAALVFAGCSSDGGNTIFQNISERTSWGTNDHIAFASFGGNGLLYVYTIKDDGGGLNLLTVSDNDEDLNDEGGRHPAFSPDATQLAIVSRRGETPAIYLIDAGRGDREGIRAVTDDAGEGSDTEPSFHPNGNQIVYTKTGADNDADIHIIDTDGANDTALVEDDDADEHWASVSPDGDWLVYQSDAAGNTDIYRLDLTNAGAVPEQLTDTAFRDEAPAWSPDGTKIAFHSDRNGDFDIFMMDADGANEVAVTADSRSDGFPVFDPAGGRLAITRDREVWTIPAQPWADWGDNVDEEAERLTRRF